VSQEHTQAFKTSSTQSPTTYLEIDLWKAEVNVTKSHTMLFKPPKSLKHTEP
jgi:hypothetical protein